MKPPQHNRQPPPSETGIGQCRACQRQSTRLGEDGICAECRRKLARIDRIAVASTIQDARRAERPAAA